MKRKPAKKKRAAKASGSPAKELGTRCPLIQNVRTSADSGFQDEPWSENERLSIRGTGFPFKDEHSFGILSPCKAGKNTKPANAVFAAIRDAWNARLEHLVVLAGEPLPQRNMEQVFPDLAGIERKLGRMLLDAFFAGDTEFPAVVRDAIKRADALLVRDRETALLPHFLRFVSTCKATTKGELKRAYEDELGRELEPRQWRILRDALGLQNMPEAPAGRPATRRKMKAAKPEPQGDGLV